MLRKIGLEKGKLAGRGFVIYELCPDYIQSKLAGA